MTHTIPCPRNITDFLGYSHQKGEDVRVQVLHQSDGSIVVDVMDPVNHSLITVLGFDNEREAREEGWV